MAQKTPSSLSTDNERQELLDRIWVANARAVLASLEQPNPKAATLTASRQFLADNGVSVDTVGKRGSGSDLGGLLTNVEKYLDDDMLPPANWTPLDERGGD